MLEISLCLLDVYVQRKLIFISETIEFETISDYTKCTNLLPHM